MKKFLILLSVVIVIVVCIWRYMSTRNDFEVGYYLYADKNCVHLSPDCSRFDNENGIRRIVLQDYWYSVVDDWSFCPACVDNEKYNIIMKKCIHPRQ